MTGGDTSNASPDPGRRAVARPGYRAGALRSMAARRGGGTPTVRSRRRVGAPRFGRGRRVLAAAVRRASLVVPSCRRCGARPHRTSSRASSSCACSALVYCVAFLVLVQQQDPLIGRDGLLPADALPREVRASVGVDRRRRRPSCRRSSGSTSPTRPARRRRGRASCSRSRCSLGATNALLQLALWALYLSFVQVGQIFSATAGRSSSARPASSRSSSARCARIRPVRVARRRSRSIWLYPLADRPHHARRRAHQAARRPVLARPHLPRLPLRDPAEPESAQLVAPRGAALVPRRRRRVQPLRRARRAVVLVLGPRRPARRRGALRRLPGDPDPERQPLVPELAHDRAGARLLRRRRAGAGSSRARLRARVDARLAAAAPSRHAPGRGVRRSWRSSRVLSIAPVHQPALAAPGDEPLVRPPASGQHLRRLRHRRPRALRGGPRGHRRREPPDPTRDVAGVRVPLQARRPDAPAVRRLAVPLPARLADVVRGDVDDRPRAVARAPRRGSCCAATPT